VRQKLIFLLLAVIPLLKIDLCFKLPIEMDVTFRAILKSKPRKPDTRNSGLLMKFAGAEGESAEAAPAPAQCQEWQPLAVEHSALESLLFARILLPFCYPFWHTSVRLETKVGEIVPKSSALKWKKEHGFTQFCSLSEFGAAESIPPSQTFLNPPFRRCCRIKLAVFSAL
jgi:hypothetical protein